MFREYLDVRRSFTRKRGETRDKTIDLLLTNKSALYSSFFII